MRRKLAAVAAFAIAVVGCGGVEREPNLAKAVERTEALGSTRFEVHTVATDDGAKFDLACDGAADYVRKRIRFRCDNAGRDEFEMVDVGGAVYYRSDLPGIEAADRKWVKTGETDDPSLPDIFSPERMLTMLRAASRNTERIGEEAVRGTPTVRYRLTVDCELAELSCSGEAEAPVEVWIDDDGRVRQIRLEEDGSITTIEFFDFGVEVDIQAPPADEVREIDVPSDSGCGTDEATPITEERALARLHHHGFNVTPDRSGYCIDGVAAVLTNAPEDFDRQGSLSCFVYAKRALDGRKTVERRGVDGGDAELLLENLRCMILADSPNAEEKIDPLEAAFEDLQRAIQP